MTVSSTTNRKTFAGNGVTTSFATSPVVFFATSDLTVFVVTTATGASTTLVENTDYTVSGGDGDVGTVDTATGTLPYGAPASGTTLVVVRTLPIVQEAEFVQNDSSDASVAEAALDKVTMMAQQLDARIDRSFTLSDSDVSGASTELPTPAATTLLGWNSAGTALQNYSAETLDQALTTPFTLTLLDDATAAAARTTLDAAQRVHSATAEVSPDVADEALIYDASEGAENRITLGNLWKVIDTLTADTSPDVADEVATYDASASGSKKVTLQNALKVVNALTALTGPDVDDSLLIYDTSASTPKKIQMQRLGVAYVLAKSGATVSAPADTSEDILATITIPAGAMGANGAIRLRGRCTHTNSANNKVFRVRIGGIGGTVMWTTTQAATTGENFDLLIINKNSASSQESSGWALNDAGTMSTASTGATAAIDTASQTTIVITVAKATGSETASLNHYVAELISNGA